MTFAAKLGSVLLAVGALAACGGSGGASAAGGSAQPPSSTSTTTSGGTSTGGTTSAATAAPGKPQQKLRLTVADGRPRHRRPTRTAHIR